MKKSLVLVLTILLTLSLAWAQNVGDYRSAVNGGNWSTAGTWERYDGSAWVTATAAPGASNNVTIRNGYDVILDASGKNCKNLYIEAGATFKADKSNPTSDQRYVRINGDSVVVNGTFGDPVGNGNNICLENAKTGGTVVITGTGIFAPSRVRVYSSANTATTIFDIDTKFMYTGSSGTGGSALYPQTDNNTFIFNAGKTIEFVNYANLTVGSSVSTASAQNVTFIVKGTLNMPGPNSSFTLLSAAGKTATLIVGPNGSVTIGKDLLTTMGGEGSSVIVDSGAITVGQLARFRNPDNFITGPGSFTLSEGGTIEIGAAAGLDPVNGPIRTATRSFSANATYIYNGTTAQVTGSDLPASIMNLTIENNAGVTLSQATNVTGTLAFKAGNLAMNGYALTYAAMSAGPGTLSESGTLNAPNAVNVGGLGAVITSGADLGLTMVKRGFMADTINGFPTITRYYDIHPTNNTGLNATLEFKYEESELNGIPENALALFSSSDNGKTWVKRGGVVDHYNNKVKLTGIDGFSRWTLGVNATMAGTYYVGAAGTKPGGGDPDFLSLKAACDSLGKAMVTAPVNMLITSDLTEPAYIAFGNPSDYQITFKPVVPATINFTQATNPPSTGWYGGWIIGTNDYVTSMVTPTRNIIIDGAVGESNTRDLTIKSSSNVTGIYPIRVAGDVDNLVIKNCILRNDGYIGTGSSSSYALRISGTYDATLGSTNPDNCIIENCEIVNTGGAAGHGIAIDGSSNAANTAFPNVTIRNCTITARTRGIFLNYAGNTEIYNNIINVNQTSAGFMSYGIWGYVIGNAAYIQNIYNNKITLLSTANSSSGDYGIVGIQCGSKGTYNVYNNFITGFAATTTAANPNCKIIGIRCQTADVVSNIFHNTIRMNNLTITPGTGTVLYAGIYIANGVNSLYNNIIVNEEDDFKAYNIYRSGLSGNVWADYNNYYLTSAVNSKIGFYNTADATTLSDWQAASTLDVHSISRAVEFAGTTDLHLAGASIGDYHLAGLPIASVSTDIDGDRRSDVLPYMGADEAGVALVLPDNEPPTLTQAEATNDSTVIVTFSEKVDTTTAETVANYAIDGGIGTPLKATVSGAGNLVTLIVNKLTGDHLYTLTVNNVKDIAGNVIAANSSITFKWVLDAEPPVLIAAKSEVDTVVVVEFSEAIDPATGGTVANYLIDHGINVPKSATVNGKFVTLIVNELEEDTLYTLTVNNVTDLVGNAIAANSQITFKYINPGLKGIYYVGAAGTRPGGGDPDFLSLKAACDALNQLGVQDNVTLFITSNLTEPVNVGLGFNPAPFKLVIKPYTATVDTITFTQATDNAGASGGFVIGAPDLTVTSTNNYGLKTVENVIIDGSNTEGGKTRDLVFKTDATAHANTYPIRIIGDVNKVTIKNCKVVTARSVNYAVLLTVRNNAGVNFVPDSVTIENCYVENTLGGAAQGIAISNSGTPTEFPQGIVFAANEIKARTRGIFLNYAGTTKVEGNQITVNQTDPGYMSYGIWGLTIGDTSFTQQFCNNKIVMLSTANSNAGDYGIIGIECASKGKYEVYNNMITGFAATTTAANPNCKVIGIRLNTANVKSNVFHNTIRMNDLTIVPGTGTVLYAGIYLGNGINNLVNNIVVNEEKDFHAYPIYRVGGTLTADYNNYHSVIDTALAYWNVRIPNLAVWQDSSKGDLNSSSVPVTFAGATDLHLAGGSIGDPNLAGVPLAQVPVDIDGNARSAVYPYMGADEAANPIIKEVMTIAAAKVDADNNYSPDLLNQFVRVRGVVTSVDYYLQYTTSMSYYFMDETGGMNLYAKFKLPLNIGDEIEVYGKVALYRGLTEVQPLSEGNVKVLSTGNLPEPRKLKLADIGEATEGLLAQVDSIRFVSLATWPATGGYATLKVTDGIDTVDFFIDDDTDLDGWDNPPAGIFGVLAISSQYTTAVPANKGYQLIGISREHFYTYPEPIKPLAQFWAKTKSTGNYPASLGNSNETRGMAYGLVDGKDRVYVVTRTAPGPRIIVYDAMSGDSVNTISLASLSGGTFPANAIGVSDDGVIFVGNLTTDAATSPFKVYKLTSESAAPVEVISYNYTGRIGDMFSVYGSVADNSVKIYAAVKDGRDIIKFETADNAATFAASIITLPAENAMGTCPSVAQTLDGSLFIKSMDKPLVYRNADGVVSTVPTEIVGLGSTNLRAFQMGGAEYLMVYYYNKGVTNAEYFDVLNVTNPANIFKVAYSTSIGTASNPNGAGALAVKVIDEFTAIGYILGTNNGLAAFANCDTLIPTNVLAKFYGDTPIIHAVPSGATGFVFGTNSYQDLGKYQRFDLKGNDQLYGFIMKFAVGNIIDTPDTMLMVVRAAAPNGAPAEVLFSIPVTTNQLKLADPVGNVFRLPTLMPVPARFFIGFEWKPTVNDEFAIYADAHGEGEGAHRVWERWSDGTFHDVNASDSYNLDVDLWITALYIPGPEVGIKEAEPIPAKYALYQNYPNPFNPTTNIRLDLPEAARVKLTVYNILGQEVMTVYKGHLPQGSHLFNISAANLPSGVYFYRVEANKFSALKKMMIIK